MPITVTIREPLREGGDVASARIQIGHKDYDVWYRVTDSPVSDSADTFLAAMLWPAMKVGGPLRINGRVSASLLRAIPTIQDILTSWCPELQRISIESEMSQATEIRKGRGVASFFSGGVDSFYTYFKNRDEITHVIFVHGFDFSLQDEVLRNTVVTAMRKAAAELGKPLVEVETNFRACTDFYADWGYYFGSALASVGLLLAPQFKKIYIPSSHSYSHLHPWGSHPLLDPLWSTDEIEIVHDGCESGRAKKVAYIAQSDIALRCLRVCWENREGAYNCGRCEKCLRTMISLRAAHALDRCPTFQSPLDLDLVARLNAADVNVKIFLEENLQAVEAAGHDPQLVQALRDALNRRYLRGRREKAHQFLDTVLNTFHPKRMLGQTQQASVKPR